MQVEDKPDITYADIGGCKEQIERLREVVEKPLLNVIFYCLCFLVFMFLLLAGTLYFSWN
jgi:hypothetical protein